MSGESSQDTRIGTYCKTIWGDIFNCKDNLNIRFVEGVIREDF
jgi:hypothetical protein